MSRKLSVKLFDDSPFTYRERISSSDVNDTIKSLRDSLLRAYLRGQRTSRQVENLSKAVNYQNYMINEKVGSITFDNDLNQVGDEHMVWKNFYNPPSVTPTLTEPADSGVEFETKYGQVVLAAGSDGSAKYSKINTFTDSTGIKRVGSNVKISIGSGIGTISTVEVTDRDDYIYSVLDGTANTFWIDDSKTYPTMAFDVEFPSSLVTRANVITVDPFPMQIVEIDDLQYRPLTATALTSLNLPDIRGLTKRSGAPIRVHFNPVDFNNYLRILMNGTQIDTGKYVYGMSDLNVEYVNYVTQGYFSHDMEIPEAPNYVINRITSFQPYYYIDDRLRESDYTVKPPISFQLVKSDGTMIWDSTSGINISSAPLDGFEDETLIRVKTIMNNVDGTTPVLKGYKVGYTVKTA